jgi:hypothetical protein
VNDHGVGDVARLVGAIALDYPRDAAVAQQIDVPPVF